MKIKKLLIQISPTFAAYAELNSANKVSVTDYQLRYMLSWELVGVLQYCSLQRWECTYYEDEASEV